MWTHVRWKTVLTAGHGFVAFVHLWFCTEWCGLTLAWMGFVWKVKEGSQSKRESWLVELRRRRTCRYSLLLFHVFATVFYGTSLHFGWTMQGLSGYGGLGGEGKWGTAPWFGLLHLFRATLDHPVFVLSLLMQSVNASIFLNHDHEAGCKSQITCDLWSLFWWDNDCAGVHR